MSGRLHLPPIDTPVEPPALVRRRAVRRTWAVGASLILALLITGARGVQLAMAPGDRTVRAAALLRWDQVIEQAPRGEILDRNGRRLATSVATPNIIVDPFLLDPDEIPSLARRVARILKADVAEIESKMRREGRYARLALRVHPAVAAEIEALRHRALWTERSGRRFYPEESLASQVLGFVDASGSGQAGIEASLDSYLRGGTTIIQQRRDRRGLAVDGPRRDTIDLHAGMNVHTTLDRTVQRIAERALEGVMSRSAPHAVSAVVVDVRTGDLLAMANAPTFNPNAIGSDPAPRRNHVVQDALEAGSVFKPFTVAAAVEEGLVHKDTPIDAERGAWYIGRTRIRDVQGRGIITVSESLKYSSNIATAKLALQMGADTFLTYLKDFGFAQRSGILLPGERAGVLRAPDRIKPIELATTSYGQGVTSTPLQLAMATAALANDGIRMRPRLVTRIEDVHGVPELVQHPAVVQRVVSAATAREVTEMMVTVTGPGGTGARGAIPGYHVAGKTGTAEKVENGRYSPTARIASFVGYVPAEDPVIAVVVQIDEPSRGSRFGGVIAAPVFAEIAGQTLRHLGIPPDPELLNGEAPALAQVVSPEPEPELPAVTDPVEPRVRLTWDGEGWTVPDLRGMPLRDVLVGLQGTGIQLRPEGHGLAIAQYPPPGRPLAPGADLEVRFN